MVGNPLVNISNPDKHKNEGDWSWKMENAAGN